MMCENCNLRSREEAQESDDSPHMQSANYIVGLSANKHFWLNERPDRAEKRPNAFAPDPSVAGGGKRLFPSMALRAALTLLLSLKIDKGRFYILQSQLPPCGECEGCACGVHPPAAARHVTDQYGAGASSGGHTHTHVRAGNSEAPRRANPPNPQRKNKRGVCLFI